MRGIGRLLEKAQSECRITRQDWEGILLLATMLDDLGRSEEIECLVRLVALLQAGQVTVEEVPPAEIHRRLAVFA